MKQARRRASLTISGTPSHSGTEHLDGHVLLDVPAEGANLGPRGTVIVLRRVGDRDRAEVERQVFSEAILAATTAGRHAADDDVLNDDDEIGDRGAVPAGLSAGQRRLGELRTLRTMLEEVRRGTVDPLRYAEVLNIDLAAAAAAAPGDMHRTGLAGAPGPGEYVDLLLVRAGDNSPSRSGPSIFRNMSTAMSVSPFGWLPPVRVAVALAHTDDETDLTRGTITVA